MSPSKTAQRGRERTLEAGSRWWPIRPSRPLAPQVVPPRVPTPAALPPPPSWSLGVLSWGHIWGHKIVTQQSQPSTGAPCRGRFERRFRKLEAVVRASAHHKHHDRRDDRHREQHDRSQHEGPPAPFPECRDPIDRVARLIERRVFAGRPGGRDCRQRGGPMPEVRLAESVGRSSAGSAS